MQRFEHSMVQVQTKNNGTITFPDIEKEGWELAQVVSFPSSWVFIFKRPVNDAESEIAQLKDILRRLCSALIKGKDQDDVMAEIMNMADELGVQGP